MKGHNKLFNYKNTKLTLKVKIIIPAYCPQDSLFCLPFHTPGKISSRRVALPPLRLGTLVNKALIRAKKTPEVFSTSDVYA